MKKTIYRIYCFLEKCIGALLFRRKKKKGWENAYQRQMWHYCKRINRQWPERKAEFLRRMQESKPELIVNPLRKLRYVWDFRLCAVFLGATVDDWFAYHLFRRNWKERRKIVTARRLRFLTEYLNDPAVRHFTENKGDFAEHWNEFFRRRYCLITSGERIPEDEFIKLFNGTDRLFVKPLLGMAGIGAYILETDDLTAAYHSLCSKNEDVIVEEFIPQTGFIHELNPSSLNTNRVVTINIGGEIEVVSSELRIGSPGSYVDNVHADGVMIQINKNTGEMDYGSDYRGNVITQLRGVSLPVRGTFIPDHEKILNFCIDAHKEAPYGLRMIGWDVCRSDEGLIMIEGNWCPGYASISAGNENPWQSAVKYLERLDELNDSFGTKQEEKPETDSSGNEKIYPLLQKWLKKRNGEDLDLLCPKTYCQKIQWLKFYDSTPVKTRLADKYLAREFVREKIGEKYLTKLLGVWTDFDEIDFGLLPDKFVLKTNHGCGYNLLVPDKSKLDIADARSKFQKWMDTNYAYEYGYEMHYRDIPRKIIAEEYLPLKKGEFCDYKIVCFDGRPEYLQFINRLEKRKIEVCVYDRDWNKQPFTFGHPAYPKDIEKPKRLDEMLEIAAKLSEGFALVRVDLYVLENDEIRFGELTFTPASGGQRWYIPKYNRILGSKIRLPEKYYMPGISYDFEKNA